MASIASKLARAAAGGCSRLVSPCLPRRLYLTGSVRCTWSHAIPAGEKFQLGTVPMPEEATQALTVTEETLKSDKALRAMYDYWRKYYGISRDRAEMDYRFSIFKKTAKFVYKTNNAGLSSKVGLNMTRAEVTRPRCDF